MKNLYPALPYLLRTFRYDQLWLSAALWALFIFISVLLRQQPAAFEAIKIYLGVVLPLVSGIMAAYALLGDPALELHFTMPVGSFRLLFERLGIVMGLAVLTAVLYQLVLAGLGFDLSHLGTPVSRQAVWFVPAATLMAVGTAAGLGLKQSTGGALFAGLLLVFEAITHQMFEGNPWGRLFYLFIGFNQGDPFSVLPTQLCLCFLSAGLLAASVVMLKRSERYI